MNTGGGSAVGLTGWLEAMVEDRSPLTSAGAVQLASVVVRTNRDYLADVVEAHIVLLEDGELARPKNEDRSSSAASTARATMTSSTPSWHHATV